MALRAAVRMGLNYLFIGFCLLATVLAVGSLALILWSLLQKGMGAFDLDVFTLATPAAGSKGGLANAIVGSILMCALAMFGALVIGLLAGTYLSEFGGKSPFAQTVRFLNDVLLSAPSILVGLFVYYILVKGGLHHFSGYAGAAALGLLALPVVIRTTEDILSLQPQALREAGSALGAPDWVVVRKIVWGSAGGGLLTGGLLAFARISGETAPLLFTSLGNQFFSLDMSHPVSSLPTVIFQFALSAYDDWRRLAWAGALIIAISVLVINVLGRILISARLTRS